MKGLHIEHFEWQFAETARKQDKTINSLIGFIEQSIRFLKITKQAFISSSSFSPNGSKKLNVIFQICEELLLPLLCADESFEGRKYLEMFIFVWLSTPLEVNGKTSLISLCSAAVHGHLCQPVSCSSPAAGTPLPWCVEGVVVQRKPVICCSLSSLLPPCRIYSVCWTLLFKEPSLSPNQENQFIFTVIPSINYIMKGFYKIKKILIFYQN